MNNKFDELTKGLAQSVTRRAALKKFGVGLAAVIAGSLGIKRAGANPRQHGYCQADPFTLDGPVTYTGQCVDPTTCQAVASSRCTGTAKNTVNLFYDTTGSTGCLSSLWPIDLNKKCYF